MTEPQFGQRFTDALVYAAELHRAQMRKETRIPYISHLMAVSGLVIEQGGDEDEAIAALLHDGPEDQGGQATLDAIGARFGDRVAKIVYDCTDTMEIPKPAWWPRKQNYLAHLSAVDESAMLVSAADKLHNARMVLADQRRLGDGVFERFTGKKDGTLWYYRELVGIYKKVPYPRIKALADELERVVAEIESLA